MVYMSGSHVIWKGRQIRRKMNTDIEGLSDKVDVDARYSTLTTVEHKVVFYIDGKKYGFRCDTQTLEDMKCEEGQVIPKLKNSWSTDAVFEDQTY